MKAKPHKPKHKRLDRAIKASAPLIAPEARKGVTFDEWTSLYHLDTKKAPLFEVVFPRSMLEKPDVYDFMYKNKIRANDYGHDQETVVTYFDDKMEAKDLRDVVKVHWKSCHVGAGPFHHKYAEVA